MTTPLPERCSPSVWAVKASSGIWDCTVTIDLSARSSLEAGPPFGKPACGSPRRRFSVIGPILSSAPSARRKRCFDNAGRGASHEFSARPPTVNSGGSIVAQFVPARGVGGLQVSAAPGLAALVEHRLQILPIGALAEAGDDALELGDVDEAEVEARSPPGS